MNCEKNLIELYASIYAHAVGYEVLHFPYNTMIENEVFLEYQMSPMKQVLWHVWRLYSQGNIYWKA